MGILKNQILNDILDSIPPDPIKLQATMLLGLIDNRKSIGEKDFFNDINVLLESGDRD